MSSIEPVYSKEKYNITWNVYPSNTPNLWYIENFGSKVYIKNKTKESLHAAIDTLYNSVNTSVCTICNNNKHNFLMYNEKVCSDCNDSNRILFLNSAREGNLEKLRTLYSINSSLIDCYTTTKHLTALHYAAGGGYYDIVEFLTENGANLYYADTEGFLPIDYAKKHNKKKIYSYLEQIMAEDRKDKSLQDSESIDLDEFW